MLAEPLTQGKGRLATDLRFTAARAAVDLIAGLAMCYRFKPAGCRHATDQRSLSGRGQVGAPEKR